MKTFFCIALATITVVAQCPSALADDHLTTRQILATAKMAGACGILDEQLHFQKTTALPGGKEFVFRFWSTEATRLGMSLKEYSDICNNAISTYDRVWKASK